MTAEDKAQLPPRAQAVLRAPVVEKPKVGRGQWRRSPEHNVRLAKLRAEGMKRYVMSGKLVPWRALA